MAKRSTGVGKGKKTRSHKTAKRLAAKYEMIQERAAKKSGKNIASAAILTAKRALGLTKPVSKVKTEDKKKTVAAK